MWKKLIHLVLKRRRFKHLLSHHKLLKEKSKQIRRVKEQRFDNHKLKGIPIGQPSCLTNGLHFTIHMGKV